MNICVFIILEIYGKYHGTNFKKWKGKVKYSVFYNQINLVVLYSFLHLIYYLHMILYIYSTKLQLPKLFKRITVKYTLKIYMPTIITKIRFLWRYYLHLQQSILYMNLQIKQQSYEKNINLNIEEHENDIK